MLTKQFDRVGTFADAHPWPFASIVAVVVLGIVAALAVVGREVIRDAVNKPTERVVESIDRLDTTMGRIDDRLHRLDGSVGRLDGRLELFGERLDAFGARLDSVEAFLGSEQEE